MTNPVFHNLKFSVFFELSHLKVIINLFTLADISSVKISQKQDGGGLFLISKERADLEGLSIFGKESQESFCMFFNLFHMTSRSINLPTPFSNDYTIRETHFKPYCVLILKNFNKC